MTNNIPYKSETSKHRDSLINFCKGYGADIGYGGDPIKPSAITIDYPEGSMAYCGDYPLQLGGDARNLYWFKDNSLDYVYSSHCLEDFPETREIINEWIRVLKKGGNLVLLLPDQKKYEEYCKRNGEEPNPAHKIKDFSLRYIRNIVSDMEYAKIIFENDIEDDSDYSFKIVIQKTRENETKEKILERKLEKIINHPWVKLGFFIKKLIKKP